MYTIGLVEDEKDLAKLIKKYLEKEGYNVITYFLGEDVLNSDISEVHLWILDIMLGGSINGYDLIKEIKTQNESVPVIFSSARDQDIDKIMGLELGGDDYIAKPYSPRELVLRVNALIKRVYSAVGTLVNYGEYTINFERRMVVKGNEKIQLTTKEFDLLGLLIHNQGQAFSRDQILDSVWGNGYFGSDRVVDDLLRRLRQKMPELDIETIYGYGYRLL